jgi:flagellar basal body-associated protein FliL
VTQASNTENQANPGKGSPPKAKAAASFFKKYFNQNGNIWKDLPHLFTGLWSPDAPTRKMTLIFFLSLVGAIGVSGIAIQRTWHIKKQLRLLEEQKKARILQELAEKEDEEKRRKDSVLSLGSFTLELKAVGSQTYGVGAINMAELEMVLFCDQVDTKEYLEQHKIQARNQMTNLLVAIDREELLSQDGKKRLKTSILKKLNSWLPRGKVEDLYFSKLILR